MLLECFDIGLAMLEGRCSSPWQLDQLESKVIGLSVGEKLVLLIVRGTISYP